MFIQTEATPNPATLKFLPGTTVLGRGTADLPDEAAAAKSPHGRRIFGEEGVAGVFLGSDFVTVTKRAGVEWDHVKHAILGAFMVHVQSGEPAMDEGPTAPAHGEAAHAEDTAIVEQIKELLDTRVRPAVAQDGGDILFDRFEPETGVVWLHMRGACSGCPSSSATLKSGVENMLRHYVPEVTRVEQSL